MSFKSTPALRELNRIEELKVDPRGLEIYRVNNDGHYEPGNIEFLTLGDRSFKHRSKKRRTCFVH